VNVFWRDDQGELDGDNTDVSGFAAMANEIVPDIPDNVRVAVLGAGGAAAAVITAIEAWPGATVTVHARDLARAAAMRMRHSVVVRACSMRDPCLHDANIVVNATPLGLGAGDILPADLDRVAPDAVLLDLVYVPGETAWVRAGRERGHPAADGLSMLLHQGIAAFERWFGVAPDREAMWTALKAAAGRP
jgi:shikimate dehydrogenase